MQSEKKIGSDFSRILNGLAGTIAGMGREAEGMMREKTREWIGESDAISRDEFEAVKAMAAAARDENDALRARIAGLEERVGKSVSGKAAKPRARPGA